MLERLVLQDYRSLAGDGGGGDIIVDDGHGFEPAPKRTSPGQESDDGIVPGELGPASGVLCWFATTLVLPNSIVALPKVRAEWAMICTADNLLKLFTLAIAA